MWLLTAENTTSRTVNMENEWIVKVLQTEHSVSLEEESNKKHISHAFQRSYILTFLLCSRYFPFQHLNRLITTYLIPLFAMVSALQTPFPFTSNGTPLYVATHWSLVWRSGWICSHIFFLGLSSFSGSPVSKQRIKLIAHNTEDRARDLFMHMCINMHLWKLTWYLCKNF